MIYYRHLETGEVFAYETSAERQQWGAPELVEMTPAEISEHLNPSPPTLQEMMTQYTIAIQQRLDDFARTRNYDGILSACTYATSTIPKFAAEGQRCVALRDATWAAGYAILAEVEAGNRPIPTVEQVMSELPALTWEEA